MATPPFLPDETKPGASNLISLYPAVEHTFREIIESWILIEHNTNGTHKQVTLDDISEPTIAADLVGIWHESGVLKTRFATGDVFNILTTNTGVPKAGATMTGLLVLSGNPAVALGATTKQQTDLKAPLASPTLTGNPVAPTQSAGNDSTRIATTAFVLTSVEGNGFAGALLHFRDEKTSGSAGGTFTQDVWQKRTIDDQVTNEISGASVSSNVITLPAGTYYVEARAPARQVDSHKAILRNTSDSTDEVIGSSSFVSDGSGAQSDSIVSGRFTIAGAKNFELQHRCTKTRNTDGFGEFIGISGVIEVYADIKIWKVG